MPSARPPSPRNKEAGASTVSRPGRLGRLFRSPVFRFVGGFALLLIAFYLLTLTASYKAANRQWLRGNAVVAGALLNALGQRTTVSGTQVSSAVFGIDIHRGCDASEPVALFVAALLAFPVRGCRKGLGLAVGVAVLLGLNQVRVLSLFFIGKHWPRFFDPMHEEVWQILFIVLALMLWAWWIVRSLARPAHRAPTIAEPTPTPP